MSIITFVRNAVIGAAILLLTATSVEAQEVFEPSDDTMVSRGDPNANYGDSWNYIIRNRYGHPSHPDRWECYLFIRFDLSSIPPGSPIESARLHLYLYRRWDSDPTGRNLNTYVVKEDWDEGTIAFANQPACPADSSGYTRVPPNNTWMLWDVTEEVQAFVNQIQPNYGWKIMDNTRWGDFNIPMMYFYSKEFGSNSPYLEIEMGPTCTVPPWTVYDATGVFTQVVIQSAMMEGLPLSEGDWIGIFDEDGCAGVVEYIGDYPVGCALVMEYELPDSSLLPGATPGNPMQFRIWDCSASEEYGACDVTFAQGGPNFGDPLTVVSSMDCQGCSPITLTLELQGNYMNNISFCGEPQLGFDLATLVNTLPDPSCLALVQDDLGRAYLPDFGISQIGNIELTRGYQVFLDCGGTFSWEVEVCPVMAADYPIMLKPRFLNNIAYLNCESCDVEEMFASIVDSLWFVLDDQGNAYIPSYFVNTIGNMQPGKGYQVYLSIMDSVIFTYPTTCSSNARPAVDRPDVAAHFAFRATGLPFLILLETASLSVFGFTQGDEIAAFDGSLCVGAIRMTDAAWQVLPAWKAFPNYELPGFTHGNLIKLKAWDRESNREYNLVTKFQGENGDRFGLLAMTVGRVSSIGLPEPAGTPTQFALCQNYPNPFNAATEISYSMPYSGKVNLLVFNLLGQEVTVLVDELQEAGVYKVRFDATNLPSGIYFYKLTTQSYSDCRKMVLMK